MSEKETVINDIIHGMITIPDYIQQIIDTPQFQRLRYISQIGLTSFVYPSATGNRFEHSIGTFHLAKELMTKLKTHLINEKSELQLSDDEIKCVEIATLCHDLGHGPHSHFWEIAFDKSLEIPVRKHEVISVEIFEDLVNSTKFNHERPIKEEIGLNEEMIDLIGRIISGKYDQEKDKNKRFLFEIVANESPALDIDKLDYLCRDSNYLGRSNNKLLDIKRIIYFFRIIKDKNDWHLALRDREIFNVYEVFSFRLILHRCGCQHRVVKSVECMFRNALKPIFEREQFRNELIENVIEDENFEYSKEIWFSKKFVSQVCDYHIWNIMKKHSKKIYRDLQERNLYKLFCQIHIENKDNNDKEIKKHILENNIFDLEKYLNEKLKPTIVSLSLTIFTVKTEKNGDPLLLINFYTKENPNKIFKYDEKTLPNLIKLKNDENVLMVFTDKKLDSDSSNKLDSLITQLCENNSLDNKIMKKLQECYNFKRNNY